MAYLVNAPEALIQLYEKGPRIDNHRSSRLPDTPQSLLKKLLCDKRMERAWNIIQKSVKKDEDYIALWKAMVEAMRIARRGIVLQTDRESKYEDIAKRAEKLAKLIAEPQRSLPTGTTLPYTGDLDLQAYELLPQDVASILGAKSYAKMDSIQRSDWAYSLLPEWPTMVELLKELAVRARKCGRKSVSAKGRNRRNSETRGMPTNVRLFSRHLFFHHFRKVDPKFNGFAAIKGIAEVVFRLNLKSNNLRTVILAVDGKTTS